MNDELHTKADAPRAGHPPVADAADGAPLRAERFDAARMAQHGRSLAACYVLARGEGDEPAERLLVRLADNAAALGAACASLTDAARDGHTVPAADLLLDAWRLIDGQVRTARHHLPPAYSRALPRLAAPPEVAGQPRVHALARECVMHGDALIDEAGLARFIGACQEGAPLTLGELWAFPIMLRLALIENLRRLAVRLDAGLRQQGQARDWAARMRATAERRPGDLLLLAADMARTNQPLQPAFVAELMRLLQGQGETLAQVLHWVDTRLADAGLTLAAQAAHDSEERARDAVSLANSLASLRRLERIDWHAFVETASEVEQVLRRDPAGVYARMDFATRDHYRHAVERLARQCGQAESAVAGAALALAEGGPDPRTRHVGHYLVGAGLEALRAQLPRARGMLPALRRAARRRPLLAYLGAIGAFTLLFTAALLVHAYQGGAGASLLVVLGLLVSFGASQLALTLTDLMVARLVAPKPLPRMDFSSGIPLDARTLVAIPALLDSSAGVRSLCEGLEVRYLANRDPQLHFCLLTDFTDAPEETMFGDAELLDEARAGIAALNARHAHAPFLLLHRPRVWSSSEQAWTGCERKRGKLADLNAYLRGGARERFMLVEGNTGELGSIRYVITLDADTQLPIDSARRMVAAMAHPLNQPLLDAGARRVIAGHALLQPRVATSLPLERTSRYERLYGGEPGIDPYTRSASNVYQDLFGEGSFIGKGIYEVDTYVRVLDGRLPDNAVLSHDLLEGCYLRSAALSDTQLVEAWPARYSDDIARRHRWIRGDWQLAGWLRAQVPTNGGGREANPLSPLARWKLFDNLRRSLVAPTLAATLVLCWSRLPGPAFWSAAALSVFFLPAFFRIAVTLVDKPHDLLWRQHVAHWAHGAAASLAHAVTGTAFLPHEAWYSVHAIARTGWRMLVSRRHLLQWKASSLVRSSTDVESAWRSMWFAPTLSVLVAVLLTFLHPFALFAAAPLLLLWFLSPLLAWWVSLPFERAPADLSSEQTRFLGKLARRSWAYFEDVVGPDSHWLAPAGIQERPEPAVTQATSPSHIGLGLLANLAAWDFGFVPGAAVLVRVRAAFESMALLERRRGHFHAGYDTRTLAPLLPLRVDTVASGSLAAHLLTLASGLERLPDAPIAGVHALAGLRATLHVVEDHAQGAPAVVRKALERCRDALAPERCRNGDTLPGLADCLGAAVRTASMLLATLPKEGADAQLRDWATRLDADCRAARDDLLALAPSMRAVQEYVLDAGLTRIPTLRELAATRRQADDAGDAELALAQMVEEGAATARARLREIGTLAACARAFADMDFGWLLRRDTHLLAPGYDLAADRVEEGACHALASNARLASFVGIALGQLPQASWSALGRQLCIVGGEQLLVSQNGAMADYLAPQLVMPAYRDTLLERSCRAAVRVQIRYAARHDIPWGMSDALCNRFDASLRYERRAFGVPGTGLARGLGDELVVAPHASLLALMVAPEAACANLERIAALGGTGRYGLYEAIDYTGARLPRGQRLAIVRAFATDHQAMGLLALSSLLHGRPMQERFEADPQLRAALLLLQEPVPATGAIHAAAFELDARQGAPEAPLPVRSVTRTGLAQPQVQLLSNGRYHVMVTGDGGGYSRWNELALTRWRMDPTCDDWGLFCYLRDLDSGALWSGAWQPTLARPEHYEAVFAEEKVQLRRRDHGIELVTEITVSPEDDVELRRMRMKNVSGRPRRIELTSYTEPVLSSSALDDAHPAFNKLFVQSEIVEERNAILCTRRPREEGDAPPWLLHAMTVHGAAGEAASFETSRADFIGRGNRNALPAAMATDTPLDGAAGAVLDPALVIRRVVTLAPDEEITVDLVLGVAGERDAALHLAAKYAQPHCVEHTFELAWAQGQALLQTLHASEADAQLYARLAGAVLYPQRALRAAPALIARNTRGQSGLWPYALSGDLPIVLVQVEDAAQLALARQLLQAHAWWRHKGLHVDLVIWCGAGASGQRSLHAQLMETIAAGSAAALLDRPGGVYLQVFEQLPEEDRLLIEAVARVVLAGQAGTLAEQLERAQAAPGAAMPALHTVAPQPGTDRAPEMEMPPLLLDNGIGGFSPDGREYLIRIQPGRPTPAPWSNVLASPEFGSVVSESGQAYTWSGNAHELRLTPWENDPVGDRGGEVFYLRDEASGAFWSPAALPAPSGGTYLTRHGFGYSVFEHTAHGIHTELTQFVAHDAPLKYSVLRVRNDSTAPRRLSATGYVEWVLGELRAASGMHVVTGRDPASGALCARNAWNSDGAEHAAFFHVDAPEAGFTCDRMEFIGRGRHLGAPRALGRTGLSGSCGAALDPCAALQVVFELAPGADKELVFMLGAGGPELVARHGGSVAAEAARKRVRAYWDETLGAVRIESPDPSLDVLANGWLVYQTLACRMWARSGYYQSGGAYGFRDQLQDAMALVHTRPQLLREHLLLCAGHQFVEGDVQHWWHPPSNGGVRTRCSDDLLWLPLATCRYIRATGDFAVLGESAPYLEGRPLDFGEESYFDLPRASSQHGDLYEHCVRAIRHSLRFGAHGLPLIGSGDWNDGLDRVGAKGRGESVWLGFFMIEVLSRFAELADRRADYGFATTCRAAAQALATQLENHAWDGEWYRRAWFDDGTPLGSKDGDECRIDLVSQSWSVLSGAAGPERAASAMAAVDTHLVWPESRLVRLLDPPFESGSLHPGSLRGYAPGVRENGGQATHAALWGAMAFARMGNVERAWELFDMLNPVRLAATMEDCARYRLEPYVVAGDVHADLAHVGRGGWSWYTGSAGWMYRLVVESLLGIERVGERLVLAPQLPSGWPGFRLQYRYRATTYAIEVRVLDAAALRVDGVDVGGDTLQLVDDGQVHRVELHVARRHEPTNQAKREQPQSKTIT